ncbi:mitogen-activated protein kinase kinase kinase NPK1-like isoform X1 [Iris pallida]|uniref:Mitogen-activated protein kinase kinase kinase NPK1-like isoform X1 n=1 Tax=Iris pallida TaxID=29817 RepID=A0AAX6G701_IRIPA|nr:mitogen-activated protein kinase kinase kinase NPK1-like isoform X1 [Iris pallida]
MEEIGSCLRKLRVRLGLGLGYLQRPLFPSPIEKESAPSVRWRRGGVDRVRHVRPCLHGHEPRFRRATSGQTSLDRSEQRIEGESPSPYKRTRGRSESSQEPLPPEYCCYKEVYKTIVTGP